MERKRWNCCLCTEGKCTIICKYEPVSCPHGTGTGLTQQPKWIKDLEYED